MAACGNLERIFEEPLSDNSTILESFSTWEQLNSIKEIEDSSFSELFGELHIHAPHETSSPSSSPFTQSSPSSSLSSNSTFFNDVNQSHLGIDIPKPDKNDRSYLHPTSGYYPSNYQRKQYRDSDSFSSMTSESLSLCTEGLGFESFDDVEDVSRNELCNNEWHHHQEERTSVSRSVMNTDNHYSCEYSRRSRTCRGEFPPPISCIGRSGKPWVLFKSYKEDGRFILKEIRIPTQEFLHVSRENGRLRLHFIQSDEEEEDEDEDEDEEVVEGKNGEDGNNEESVETGNGNGNGNV
ncbi:hypothetical protein ACJIZ3_012176 [Penstemon smallii]|uniref:FAF domain-containing protein n=1 Tax=Penstemon smallii TaxID=265156 RepID=A0ABD3UL97_9LAMI